MGCFFFHIYSKCMTWQENMIQMIFGKIIPLWSHFMPRKEFVQWSSRRDQTRQTDRGRGQSVAVASSYARRGQARPVNFSPVCRKRWRDCGGKLSTWRQGIERRGSRAPYATATADATVAFSRQVSRIDGAVQDVQHESGHVSWELLPNTDTCWIVHSIASNLNIDLVLCDRQLLYRLFYNVDYCFPK